MNQKQRLFLSSLCFNSGAKRGKPFSDAREEPWEMCHNARPIALHFKTFCIFFHEALCFWNETEVLSITMWKGNLSLNDTLGSLKRVPYGAPISRTDAFFHQHNNNNNTAAACYTEWSITFIWMSLWNAINGEFLIVATSKDKRVLSSSSSAQISTLFFPSLKQ